METTKVHHLFQQRRTTSAVGKWHKMTKKRWSKKGQSRNIQMQFLMTSPWQIVSVRLVDCGWFVWLYTVQATALIEWFPTMYPMRFLTISYSNILFDKSPHFCWWNRRPACFVLKYNPQFAIICTSIIPHGTPPGTVPSPGSCENFRCAQRCQAEPLLSGTCRSIFEGKKWVSL